MSLTFLVTLVILICLVLGCAWFVAAAWTNPATQSVSRAKHGPSPEEQAAASAILAQGGLQTLRQYLQVFPEACPQCGGRTRYEGLVAPPTTAPRERPLLMWLCPRCGYGTGPELAHSPVRRERTITSPYLSVDQSVSIPEPPYYTPGPDIHHIFLLNNPTTPADVVEQVLETVFDRPPALARQITLDAHYQGKRFVIALPQGVAESQVMEAVQRAQVAGYTLEFRIRPSEAGDDLMPPVPLIMP